MPILAQQSNIRLASRRVLALLAVMLCCAAGSGRALAQAPTNWLTGRALDGTLRRPVGISWPGNPLSESLARLANSQRVCVYLDRRVDPARPVTLEANRPLDELFELIAAEHNTQQSTEGVRPRPAGRLGVTRLGDVIVFAPVDASVLERTVAEIRHTEVNKLPASRKLDWLKARPLSWQAGATPEHILAKLAKDASLQITNLSGIPHDVWPAADFPPLDAVNALTLILSNFDLTFRISANGAQLTLDKIGDDDMRVEKTYGGGTDPQQLASDITANFPDARVEVRGRQLIVQARVEEHEQISGEKRPGQATVGGTEVYSLQSPETGVPVGQVIDHLATKLNLQVRWDEPAMAAAGISKDTLVTFNVAQQPVDKLLEAVLAPAGLQHKREGEIVTIRPKN